MDRCINCGIRSSKEKTHPFSLENESEGVHELIQKHTGITELPKDSVICEACNPLLRQAVESPESCINTIGHKNICIVCGRSVAKIRNFIVSKYKDVRQIDVIKEKILPRILRISDLLCLGCHISTTKLARLRPVPRTSNTSKRAGYSGTSTEDDTKDIFDPDLPNKKLKTDVDASVSTDRVLLTEGDESFGNSSNMIVLSQYKRAAVTSSRCSFKGCQGREKLRIPLPIRIKVFKDYNYFLPTGSRVCSRHLYGNFWEEMKDYIGLHTFTEKHIYELMSLSRGDKSVNFENIDLMDDHLVKYWFGMDKERIHDLMSEIPQLTDMPQGQMALAAFLFKLKNGETNARIASLFQIPVAAVDTFIREVKTLLGFNTDLEITNEEVNVNVNGYNFSGTVFNDSDLGETSE